MRTVKRKDQPKQTLSTNNRFSSESQVVPVDSKPFIEVFNKKVDTLLKRPKSK